MNQLLARKAVRFVAILGGGIVVALAIWIATNVFNLALPGTDTSPIEVRLIAAPAAFGWVSEAAERFNAEGRRLNRRPISIQVIEQDGLSLYVKLSSTGLRPAPSAWIAEGTFTLDLVNLAARQATGQDVFAAEGSVAQSVLMWGGFADRVSAIDSRLGGLTWSALQEAAVAPNGWSSLGGQSAWGFFKLVLPDPGKSSEGLAAVLSAVAEYHGKTDLTATDVNDAGFQRWAQALIDAVPNFANLGTEAGAGLAVRGPSAGDAGLLLEADWLIAAEGLNNWQSPVFRYAPTAVAFDFPFSVWVGAEAADLAEDVSRGQAEQEAARLFREYLLEPAQQARTEAFGLRTVSGQAANIDGGLFARWASIGVQSAQFPTSRVQASADAVLAALRWTERAVGR